MTKRIFLPDLKCHSCGHDGNDYSVREVGQHTEARCGSCRSWIKYLSKEDKYGTKEQQREIWNKTGGLCCYCGRALNPFIKNGYTHEHMEPQNNGGSHCTENLYPCCKSCNSQKGDKSLSEYRKYMRGLTGRKTHVFHFEILEYGPKHISEVLKMLTIGNTINKESNDNQDQPPE